jgi:hypothetical protein
MVAEDQVGNNVKKNFGERKEQGGVKGVMNKITDKLNPSHDKPVQQEVSSFLASCEF